MRISDWSSDVCSSDLLVAERYGISRAQQDEYALQSQQRTAAAQQDGSFDDEIVAMTASKQLFDKEGNPGGTEQVTLSSDEGNRPSTTLESLRSEERRVGKEGVRTCRYRW